MIQEIIRVAPWVEDCTDCGMHGRIAYPDGSKSKEFASKETALGYILEQRELGAFTTEEHDTLKWMICNTNWRDSEPSPEVLENVFKIVDELVRHIAPSPEEMDMKDTYFSIGNETTH